MMDFDPHPGLTATLAIMFAVAVAMATIGFAWWLAFEAPL